MSTALPNLIVAGVHKAGSTSLFTWLSWHPDVGASSKKELHYFTPIRYGGEAAPLVEYSRYFNGLEERRYRLEASPSYFYGGKALAEAMDAALESPRVIVLLRNPAKRFVSFYKHLKANLSLPESETFADFLKQSEAFVEAGSIEDEYHQRGLREGHYIHYLPEWQEHFGDRSRVVFFEDLVANPEAGLTDLCQWLGLDAEPYRNRNFSAENQTTHYSNRLLHGLAVGANRALEPVLRKSHGLKKAIRKVYYSMNSGKLEETVSEAQHQWLAQHYAESNKALRAWLEANGHSQLPGWLLDA